MPTGIPIGTTRHWYRSTSHNGLSPSKYLREFSSQQISNAVGHRNGAVTAVNPPINIPPIGTPNDVRPSVVIARFAIGRRKPGNTFSNVSTDIVPTINWRPKVYSPIKYHTPDVTAFASAKGRIKSECPRRNGTTCDCIKVTPPPPTMIPTAYLRRRPNWVAGR